MPSSEPPPVVILIAEDDLLVRLSAADVLQDAGYRVLEARDGVEAIAILELRDDVAAIFTDISMPGVNGVALAKIVRQGWPHVGVVMTSGALPSGMSQQLPSDARFLPKPYSPEALLREIAAVIPISGAPIGLNSLPTLQPGKPDGAGGIAQPLPEPEQ